MTEEERNEKNEQVEKADAGEQPEPEAPEAAEAEAPEAEAPEAEVPEAEAEAEAKAPEAEAKAPAEEPAEAPEADGDDELEGLDWKARQRLLRSRESGAAGPERKPEQRASERAARRRAAGVERKHHRVHRREKHQAGTGTVPAERRSAGRKERLGIVVSNKSDKTITVRIDSARRHPTYEKIVRRTNTLRAHDERNEAGEGDTVRIVETRPLSKQKRWRLVEVLEKAK
jgi:small subunit ribosomal protein S17